MRPTLVHLSHGMHMAWVTLTVAGAMAVSAGSVAAQVLEASVVIEHIAGNGIYLGVGAAAGLRAGDSLTVVVRGRVAGRLVVEETSTNRALATFVGSPFALTRGQSVVISRSDQIQRPAGADAAASEPGDTGQTVTDRRSLLEGVGAERPAPTRRRSPSASVHGRIFLDMNSSRSVVAIGAANQETRNVTRSYISPSTGLRLYADNLPGGARLDVNMRGTYQRTGGATPTDVRILRVYQASMSGGIAGGRAAYQVGRFVSQSESASGSWDGLAVSARRRGLGGGVALGFEPERYSHNASLDMPKASAFVSVDTGRRKARYRSEYVAVVRRTSPELAPHMMLSTSHDVHFGRGLISGEVDFDRNTAAATWNLSRLAFRGSVPVGPHVSTFGRFALRRPYAYWRPSDPVTYRRDSWSAGVSARAGGVTMLASLTDNRTDGRAAGRGYNTSLRIDQTRKTPLGLVISVSLWSLDQSAVYHLSANADRSWGAFRLSTGYTYYGTRFGGSAIRSHLVNASVSVPLIRRVSASVQARAQVGGYADRTSIYTRLWMSF